jgi:hypothetical protein
VTLRSIGESKRKREQEMKTENLKDINAKRYNNN